MTSSEQRPLGPVVEVSAIRPHQSLDYLTPTEFALHWKTGDEARQLGMTGRTHADQGFASVDQGGHYLNSLRELADLLV